MRRKFEAPPHCREDVSETLAALQAQAAIAGVIHEAELSGRREYLPELRRQLAAVQGIMARHGDLCRAIRGISGYIRRPIPLLRIEDLAVLYEPARASGT